MRFWLQSAEFCSPCKWRFVEVIGVSVMVSVVTFLLPLVWVKCTPSPTDLELHELPLLEELVSFQCESGKEYNELASHYFTNPGVAIRQLFHLHKRAFLSAALLLSGGGGVWYCHYIWTLRPQSDGRCCIWAAFWQLP
jgi:chloride channel 7